MENKKTGIKKRIKEFLKRIPVIKQLHSRYIDLRQVTYENNASLKDIQQKISHISQELPHIKDIQHNVTQISQELTHIKDIQHNVTQISQELTYVKNIDHTVTQMIQELTKVKNWTSFQRVPGYTGNMTTREQMGFSLMAFALHKKTFPQFRNINYGKDVVLCGTGPTFNNYSMLKNAVHIGLNIAYERKDIALDYIFIQDTKYRKIVDDVLEYKKGICKKFFIWYFPVLRDYSDDVYRYVCENIFNYDIDFTPLPDFTSVAFAAASFALWTYPKRLFLVGCDCSKGYFTENGFSTADKSSASHLVNYWQRLRNFASWNYPQVEIISVNPVGLKGMFNDVYTQSYLEENPEIDKNEVKVFDYYE